MIEHRIALGVTGWCSSLIMPLGMLRDRAKAVTNRRVNMMRLTGGAEP